ncbi:hypothetical protein M436DRAFT_82947 [Aureobasidium namibiae CBS 147.97]|uniref:Uncharacterized protein n=1 Tax=Aureobasidium namibiae CBS 147.97 TaxID=1043004 RepID=A0A074WQR2_9PEZI|nr:uncharacterized protein M436DRAFT_82947 [Aureobasidium namibiae CBS 147.97]KEQ72037.1 hypothetical protein M436DRAFT_82947 [Aureobasidium namibiae CBS 147.97]
MDAEAAKEVLDLVQNQISSILIRKRQREEAALEHENEQLKLEQRQLQDENDQLKRENNLLKGDNRSLKDEDQHLKQRLTCSIQRCFQANQRLEKLKQSNKELDEEVLRLENDKKQRHEAWLDLNCAQRSLNEEAKRHAQTIKTLEEQVHKLNREKQSLQHRLEQVEQYEVACKKTVSKLKMKLSLALEDLSEFDSNLGNDTLLEVVRYINKEGDHSVIEIDSD